MFSGERSEQNKCEELGVILCGSHRTQNKAGEGNLI